MSLTSDMWHYTVLLYHLGEQREQVRQMKFSTKYPSRATQTQGLTRDLVALEKFNQLTRKSAESSEGLPEKQKDITEE